MTILTLNILKVFMKFDEKELISTMKELQAYSELIIYTFLPETLVNNMLQNPGLQPFLGLFSYIFTRKDCIETEDAVLKDLTKLLPTRSKT
jgi:hypothetical protein